MKSVVMIAYFFPPEANAGTFRPLRFVRHLSRRGWRTAVVSANPYRYERYDASLLASIPSETEVVQVRGRDPWQALQARRGKQLQEKLAGVSGKVAEEIRSAHHRPFRSRMREAVRAVEAGYYLPDMARPWIRPAARATIKLCQRNRPSVIWATAGPVSAWVAAQQASRRTGVPYVLDLRDPYGLDYYDFEVRQPAWAKRRYGRTLNQLFKEAQSVVVMFDTLAECYVRAYPDALDASKIHIIPNGYEGTIEASPLPSGDKCLILYTGTLSSYRYDTFLLALHSLKQTEPALAGQLRLLFVGDYMEEIARDVSALGLSDMVETASAKSQAEVRRLHREAHALLILGRRPERKGHELVAGAKLFDYFKARRPIIGVLPQDETRKILGRVGVTTVADADSAPEIVAVLRQLVDAWTKEVLASLLPHQRACEAFSAEQQTDALVRALECAPSAEPFVSGLTDIPLSLRGGIAR